jgi:hypothetical protein
MKQRIFTLIMLLALIVVAGSAFGQGSNTSPYRGQTYSYSLSGITVINESSVLVDYSGAGGVPSTVADIPAATSNGSISFTVAYNATAVAGNLKVTITDKTSTCSNFIQIPITPVDPPTLALNVARTTAAEICQLMHSAPANNTAASVPAGLQTLINTVTFTVTPTITGGSGNETFAYTFDITDYLIGATDLNVAHSGTGTASGGPNSAISVTGAKGVQTFNVTFVTTPGVANEVITGSLTGTPVLTVTGTGTGTYNGTVGTNGVTATVKTVPNITGTIN